MTTNRIINKAFISKELVYRGDCSTFTINDKKYKANQKIKIIISTTQGGANYYGYPTIINGSQELNVTDRLGLDRDLLRRSALGLISTSLFSYYQDFGVYPQSETPGCAPSTLSGANSSLIIDSSENPLINDGCNVRGRFAYKIYNKENSLLSKYGFALGATLENPSKGNSSKPLTQMSDKELEWFTPMLGSGPYYILTDIY